MFWWSLFFPEKFYLLKKNKEDLKNFLLLFPSKKIFIDNHFAVLSYQNKDLKQLLYIFKKRPQPMLKTIFCELMAEKIMEDLSEKKLFNNQNIIITCIPKKIDFKKNYYNQAEILARGIAKILKVEFKELLKKVKKTKKQAQLGRKDRLENLKMAFETTSHIDQNCLIIVIDDIITTGGTITEAKRALKIAGAKEIWSLTLFS